MPKAVLFYELDASLQSGRVTVVAAVHLGSFDAAPVHLLNTCLPQSKHLASQERTIRESDTRERLGH
jgi:hypothetical protein